ncbi:hypothetical protein CEXT_722261 [Caerostris extrusa]|uniref:Uncharacterized protein n=1 Tax=Caerostris extrusa TaxID=172846 RepID=A0AAV4XCT8_CAEEX|nr:hypothetical protein CEXT_722261 [Caerostris extrusa]
MPDLAQWYLNFYSRKQYFSNNCKSKTINTAESPSYKKYYRPENSTLFAFLSSRRWLATALQRNWGASCVRNGERKPKLVVTRRQWGTDSDER